MESTSENNEIGSQLQAAREAQDASLDDISALLKIRSDHLQALENGDFDRLPGHVYAVGFIRTYATHLGLNAADLVSRFKEATMTLPLEEGYNGDTDGEPISLGLKLGLGVFAVFLVYLMWLIAGGAGTDEQLASVQKQEDMVSASPAPAKPVTAAPSRPVIDNSQSVKASPSPVSPSSDPALSASLQVEAETDEPQGEPVAPVGSAETIAIEPLVEVPEIVTAAMVGKVEIRASRRTWMRIENRDGTVLFSSIIRDGDSFELQEGEAYTLATRDAGALHYFVDETKVGDVGRRGQILTARQFDRAAIIALRP